MTAMACFRGWTRDGRRHKQLAQRNAGPSQSRQPSHISQCLPFDIHQLQPWITPATSIQSTASAARLHPACTHSETAARAHRLPMRPTAPLEFSPETPSVSSPSTPPLFLEDQHHHSTVPEPTTGTLGLAARLRNATAQVHEEVQQPAVVLQLVGGRLAQPIHLRYLYMLHAIYAALERGLAAHASHPLLAACHDPALLARAPSIEADMGYYVDLDEPGQGWERSAVAEELRLDPPGALVAYAARLDELAADESLAYLLLTHAYVRYREFLLLPCNTFSSPADPSYPQSATFPAGSSSPARSARPTPCPRPARARLSTSSSCPTSSALTVCPSAPGLTTRSGSRSGSGRAWTRRARA